MAEEPESPFPAVMYHLHGLHDWAVMMRERSAETIVPGEPPSERIYRCQDINCGALVKVETKDIRPAT